MPNNHTSGTLPIFRLGEPRMTADIVRQLTDGPEPRLPIPAAEFIEHELFGFGDNPGPPPIAGRWLHFRNGELTYLNQEQLWKPGPHPADFVDKDAASVTADALLEFTGLQHADHADVS